MWKKIFVKYSVFDCVRTYLQATNQLLYFRAPSFYPIHTMYNLGTLPYTDISLSVAILLGFSKHPIGLS